MTKGGARVTSRTFKKRRGIRPAIKKTRKVRASMPLTRKESVMPATVEMLMNVEPTLRRSTRRAAAAATEFIRKSVDPKALKEAERTARAEVAAKEAERKARAAARKAAAAEKKAIEAEKKEFTRPIGTRGESVANVTEMFSMLTVPSAGVNNSGSPVPVYRTKRKLSPVVENY